MRVSALLAVSAAVLLAGCGRSAPRCVAHARDWPFAQPFTAGIGPVVHQVQAGRGGALWLDGRRSDLGGLDRLIDTAARRLPPPHIVVRQRPPADCETIEAVRDRMDGSSLCVTGHCAEGRVWDARAVKPGRR